MRNCNLLGDIINRCTLSKIGKAWENADKEAYYDIMAESNSYKVIEFCQEHLAEFKAGFAANPFPSGYYLVALYCYRNVLGGHYIKISDKINKLRQRQKRIWQGKPCQPGSCEEVIYSQILINTISIIDFGKRNIWKILQNKYYADIVDASDVFTYLMGHDAQFGEDSQTYFEVALVASAYKRLGKWQALFGDLYQLYECNKNVEETEIDLVIQEHMNLATCYKERLLCEFIARWEKRVQCWYSYQCSPLAEYLKEACELGFISKNFVRKLIKLKKRLYCHGVWIEPGEFKPDNKKRYIGNMIIYNSFDSFRFKPEYHGKYAQKVEYIHSNGKKKILKGEKIVYHPLKKMVLDKLHRYGYGFTDFLSEEYYRVKVMEQQVMDEEISSLMIMAEKYRLPNSYITIGNGKNNCWTFVELTEPGTVYIDLRESKRGKIKEIIVADTADDKDIEEMVINISRLGKMDKDRFEIEIKGRIQWIPVSNNPAELKLPTVGVKAGAQV